MKEIQFEKYFKTVNWRDIQLFEKFERQIRITVKNCKSYQAKFINKSQGGIK